MSLAALSSAMVQYATTLSQPSDSLGTVVDEVIWVVGDEAILKSDVEAMRVQGQQEGMHWKGDPDCAIPEQIAVQKLFLNQAIIDSIEVTEADISAGVEQYLERMISVIGSREKLEEYHKKTISQIRADLRESYRERQMVQGMQQKLVKDIAVTPAEVRRYFKDMPQDSMPFVPTEVEVQIITQQPRVSTRKKSTASRSGCASLPTASTRASLPSRRWHVCILRTRVRPGAAANWTIRGAVCWTRPSLTWHSA